MEAWYGADVLGVFVGGLPQMRQDKKGHSHLVLGVMYAGVSDGSAWGD